MKFTDKVGIQADLLYSQQGAEFDAGEFDLSYVNIPVVLKYYLVQGLNIQAGPQFGFVVDDKISIGLKNFIRKVSNFYDLPSFLDCL